MGECKRKKKLTGRLSCGPAVAAVIIASAFLYWWFCLPAALFRDPYSKILLSEDGRLLAAKISSDEQWRFPPLKDIPEKYEKALILFEDRRFYRHFGVDPIALARSAYLNFKRGKIVSGGSTITMQVIRLSRKTRRGHILKKRLKY